MVDSGVADEIRNQQKNYLTLPKTGMNTRLTELWESIDGVSKEIDRRRNIINHMKNCLLGKHPDPQQCTPEYIYLNGPKLLKELRKLKLIKNDLVYLAGLEEFL